MMCNMTWRSAGWDIESPWESPWQGVWLVVGEMPGFGAESQLRNKIAGQVWHEGEAVRRVGRYMVGLGGNGAHFGRLGCQLAVRLDPVRGDQTIRHRGAEQMPAAPINRNVRHPSGGRYGAKRLE